MAYRTANCTCKTCGREFKKEMYGRNSSDAHSKAEWAELYFDECPDCYKIRKQRERETANAVAALEAKNAGLPELTGTEKQVAWATTLRKKALDKARSDFRMILDAAREKNNPSENIAAAERMFERFVRLVCETALKASWWIDNHYSLDGLNAFIDKFPAEWKAAENEDAAPVESVETPDETELRKAAEVEMITAPANQMHNGTVEIIVTDASVSSRYKKDDDFRAVVKSLGYRWDTNKGVWVKKIGVRTGTAEERAAELGNHLLNAGFAVQIADPETRQKAIDGDYKPEHRRWIWTAKGEKYKNKLLISWAKDDNLYNQARKINGSKYDAPDVVVPVKSWMEVLDFADMYDFKITLAAQEMIDAQRAMVVSVKPAPVKKVTYHENNPADILNSGAGVLDDLRDD